MNSRPASAVLASGALYAQHYLLGERLGAGGTGVVHSARHVALQQERALKILTPRGEAGTSEEVEERLRFEASVYGRLRGNASVVMPMDVGFDAATRTHFVAMELLRGSDLGRCIREHGPISPEAALHVLRQVAVGVDAAHGYVNEAGEHTPIVHRDLTPSNLFVLGAIGGQPQVKILDFGLAQVLEPRGERRQGSSGTALFRSYEQANGLALAPQTDIWALGLVVYFMLSGEHYWQSRTSAELQREITSDELEAPSQRLARRQPAARLPAAFDAWLLRCLERVPARRFPSAAEAAGALDRCFDGEARSRAIVIRNPALARDVLALSGPETLLPSSHARPVSPAGGSARECWLRLAEHYTPSLRGLLRSTDDLLTAAGHHLAFAPDQVAVFERQLAGIRVHHGAYLRARDGLNAELPAFRALLRELHRQFPGELYSAAEDALAQLQALGERSLEDSLTLGSVAPESLLYVFAEHAARWQAERGRWQARIDQARRACERLERELEVAVASLPLSARERDAAVEQLRVTLADYVAGLGALHGAVLRWCAALPGAAAELRECGWQVLAPGIVAMNGGYSQLEARAPSLRARLLHPQSGVAHLAAWLQRVQEFQWYEWRPEINALIVPVIRFLVHDGREEHAPPLRAQSASWQAFLHLLARGEARFAVATLVRAASG